MPDVHIASLRVLLALWDMLVTVPPPGVGEPPSLLLTLWSKAFTHSRDDSIRV